MSRLKIRDISVTPERVKVFWSRVRKTKTCWTWTGTMFTQGYGNFWDGNRNNRTNRYSYVLHFGPIKDKTLLVCHHCNNKACVRPEHLYLGTNKQNIQDATRDGLMYFHNTFKTHCVHGHKFNKNNTYVRRDRPGYRQCKECGRINIRRLRNV